MKTNQIDILTKNCFKNIDDKGIFVIGCNKNADIFINMYRNDYKINAVISYDKDSIGKTFNGFNIKGKRSITNKIGKAIICEEPHEDIINHLKKKGIKYGIYSSEFIYPGRQVLKFKKNSNKKYHVGYVAGVFDLFHIGHLNIIKNAKELCDYLIVGVVSDKGAIEKNKKDLVVPFDERIEIVRSCKYVDEAVEIPFKYSSTYYAYRKYHFDIQISGDDHKLDPYWISVKNDLKALGSDIVYFPYTKQTSTTDIKNKVKNIKHGK